MIATKEELSSMSDDELKTLLSKYKQKAKIFDGKQNAIKINLNSCYGTMGNKHFAWYRMEQAEAITLSSQAGTRSVFKLINDYMTNVEKVTQVSDFVIYSDTDSCSGDTLIHVNGENIKIEDYFEKINDGNVDESPDRDFTIPVSGDVIKCYDENTKSSVDMPVNYVMRHKVKKRMYRIKIGDRHVDVTEDHSICVEREGRLISVKPLELKPTDILYVETEI